MKTQIISRRFFFKNTVLHLGLLSGIAVFIAACGKDKKAASSDPCKDFSEVPQEEITKRKKLGYVDQSPLDESTCSTCNLYLGPNETRKCGGCMLFKGPVESKGYCTYWAAKQEAG